MNVQVKVGLGFQFSQSRIAAADPDSDKKFLLKIVLSVFNQKLITLLNSNF